MRKKLKDLAALVEGAEIVGDPHTVLTDIVQDSRQVSRGAMFVALAGAHVDGHTFIPAAAVKGAAAVLTETEAAVPPGMAVLQLPDRKSVV